MTNYLTLYLVTLPILVLLDLLWVGVIASKFYNTHLAHLRGEVMWAGAILFYLVYTAGIILFVVLPYADDLQMTALMGVAFGLVVYGVYNFTNHAVLDNWPMVVVWADLAWGIFMTLTISLASHYMLGQVS